MWFQSLFGCRSGSIGATVTCTNGTPVVSVPLRVSVGLDHGVQSDRSVDGCFSPSSGVGRARSRSPTRAASGRSPFQSLFGCRSGSISTVNAAANLTRRNKFQSLFGCRSGSIGINRAGFDRDGYVSVPLRVSVGLDPRPELVSITQHVYSFSPSSGVGRARSSTESPPN